MKNVKSHNNNSVKMLQSLNFSNYILTPKIRKQYNLLVHVVHVVHESVIIRILALNL